MRVFPAIDIQGGHCVRLRRGDFRERTVFGTDPVQIARLWEAEGARRLHVVDLDGARVGILKNVSVVQSIVSAVGIPVQLGGGIRSLDSLDLVEQCGVARVVVGTAAVSDRPFLEEALKRFGEKLIVAVDAQEGYVATHGWQKRTYVPVVELVSDLSKLGVREVLYTDIERDGMMSGINLKAYEDLALNTDVEIIASGGVTTIEDIRSLKKLEPLGVTGVIVGRALYEGAFTLAEALAAAGDQ